MSTRKQATLLFCLLLFCYAFVHQDMGWNQNSRLDLLHALFVHKTFRIDAYHENTGDKSVHEGHYYSDKAPGIVFLAIPAFAVGAELLSLLNVSVDSPEGWLATSWMTTVGSVGLITALGGVALFLLLCHLVEQRTAFLTTVITFLGAAPFPYATMLFSHAAVMALICIALWAIADDFLPATLWQKDFPVARRPNDHLTKRHLFAGLCCGLAIASEYTAAVAAAGVLVLALSSRFKHGFLLGCGSLLPLSIIPIYNWICFGGPLSFGYHHLVIPEFQQMNHGLFGITFPPKFGAAYLILLSPHRGLFFWTPFFLLAFAGLKACLEVSLRLFWVSVSVVLVQVLCISGYYMPSGGWALGPRHLAPMLPFVAIVAALGFQQFPRFGCILGYCSLLFTGLGTVIDAMPDPAISFPLLQLYAPRFQRGEFACNLAQYVGVPRVVGGTVLIVFVISIYVWVANRPASERGKPNATRR